MAASGLSGSAQGFGAAVAVDGGSTPGRRRRASPSRQTALGAIPVDDGVDRALVAQLVAEAIETLSPEHRAAVVETYFRGHSVAEAAGALGVPAGTVKSRTYYALRALRLALEERGISGLEEAT